ncbi:hypothetical protein JCM11251_005280 [Rhodosporidiobolus azoricus]
MSRHEDHSYPRVPKEGADLTFAYVEKGDSSSDKDAVGAGGVDSAEEQIHQQFTYTEQRSILKRIDLYIMPILILAYLNKNLDVNNISNIKIIDQGTSRNILNELNMTSDDYAWLSTIYTIPFIIFEVPSNLLFKIQGPRQLFFRICALWSIAAALHAAAYNKGGLYAARFFLGVFEAGLFPGIYTHFSYWYRPDEMAIRVCAVGILGSFSGILSALIAYGIDHIGSHVALSPWRIMFLVEGLSGLMICALIWFFLPDYPNDAKFLTHAERQLVIARLPPNGNRKEGKAFDKQEILATLTDPLLYAFTGVQMFSNLGTYGLQWWLPTIIASFGLTGSTASSQLLNIPPAAVGVIVSLFFAWLSDRTFSFPRPMYLILSKVVCIGAFIGLTLVTNKGALYALIIIATMGSTILSSVLFSWRAQTYKGSTSTAFTLAFQNGLSQLSGVVSPQIFQSKFAPRYTTPYCISIAFLFLSVLSTFWAWWLTADVERETRRVAAIRFKEGKERNALTAVDIDAAKLK